MAHKQRKLRSFHLFAGAGGGILADLLLGHQVIGACEIEEYPRNVLLARQRDKILPEFPIWDNVQTLDGKPWRGSVDVLCGGFPCTDVSSARTNSNVNGERRGLDGESSGLWFEQLRITKEMSPSIGMFAENSNCLRTKGLATILQGLDELGYYAKWCVLKSAYIGADHHRPRMWIFAYPNKSQCKGGCASSGVHKKHSYVIGSGWRKAESHLERVANGVASGLDANWGKRLKAIGNGQDPRVAALAFSILTEGLI